MSEFVDYDAYFAQIAGRLGGIAPLLDAFFGFLHRKTDFYVQFDPVENKNASMGFPLGRAEKMVTHAFRKFPLKALDSPPSLVKGHKEASQVNLKKQEKLNDRFLSTNEYVESASISQTTQAATSSYSMKYNSQGKQIPIGNGGITEKYYWIQSLKDVTVYVDVPMNTRGKDILCSIQPSHLHLEVKGTEGALIDGDFYRSVKLDDSLWSLVSPSSTKESPQVVITLEKVVPTWWDSVIQGHPEIDTSQVDSSQRLEEYDTETQAAIRKIMFNEKQKRLGLPTTDEMAADTLLEKAKGLPGSPFLEGEPAAVEGEAGDGGGYSKSNK